VIDFKSGTMRLESPKPEPIVKWVVYFQTPKGLYSTLPEAVACAEELCMPLEGIQPVPVALDAHGHYEVCVR
jgi:hypothetical protein